MKKYSKKFAPANIALIKYWGKRDKKLNLPTHSSLSLSLANLGTITDTTYGASSGGAGININDLDPLYDEVVDLITSTNKASASMIQRKFKVGYNRAGRIIDELEETGVIRKPDGSNNWEVVGRQDLTPQPEVETITIDQAREQLTSDEKMDFTQNVEIKYEEKDEDDKLIADEEDDGENLLDEVENS